MTEARKRIGIGYGHEIAHCYPTAFIRAAEAASRLSIPTIAATLAAILLGTQAPAFWASRYHGYSGG